MARFTASILGEATGNAGRANFYRWRGKSFVRGRMIERGNANATAAQISVQRRFSLLSEFLKKCAPALRLGFVKVPDGKTYMNVAFTANWDTVKQQEGSWVLTPADMVMSNGVDPFTVKSTPAGNTIDFTWTAPKINDAFYDGKVVCVAYNSANDKTAIFLAAMSASSASFSLSSLITGEDDNISAWQFCSTGIISSPTTFIRVTQ